MFQRRMQLLIILGLALLGGPIVSAEEAAHSKNLNVAQIRDRLRTALPSANIAAFLAVGDRIILTGWVPKQDDGQAFHQLLESLRANYQGEIINGVNVGIQGQVQLDLVVARVDRAGLEQAEPDLFREYQERQAAMNAVGDVRTRHLSEEEDRAWQTLLSKVNAAGHATLLAETHFVTLNGKPPCFLNHPAIRVEMLPILQENGKIRLRVKSEFNAPDPGSGAVADGAFVPGRCNARVRTVKSIEPGEAVAILFPEPLEHGRDLVVLVTAWLVPVLDGRWPPSAELP